MIELGQELLSSIETLIELSDTGPMLCFGSMSYTQHTLIIAEEKETNRSSDSNVIPQSRSLCAEEVPPTWCAINIRVGVIVFSVL